MDIEVIRPISGRKQQLWAEFLAQAGLEADLSVQTTVLVWENGRLIATGSRQDNVLKCIAVAEDHQGEDLTAKVVSRLREDAFRAGCSHLFLYTKPQNRLQFTSLLFYPIAQTRQVLLMEDRPDGIGSFLNSLPAPVTQGRIGAVVMNCDPFTLGHRYLIETAAKNCDWLYAFILSEDKGHFPARQRMEMVLAGTKDIPNLSVLPTGPYLISAASFPTYFLKERDKAPQVHCQLDIQIFCRHFAPHFGINCRFVGTEPLSDMTRQYNEALMQQLPENGIALTQLPRLEQDGQPVSASCLRRKLAQKDRAAVARLIPESTMRFLEDNDYL